MKNALRFGFIFLFLLVSTSLAYGATEYAGGTLNTATGGQTGLFGWEFRNLANETIYLRNFSTNTSDTAPLFYLYNTSVCGVLGNNLQNGSIISNVGTISGTVALTNGSCLVVQFGQANGSSFTQAYQNGGYTYNVSNATIRWRARWTDSVAPFNTPTMAGSQIYIESGVSIGYLKESELPKITIVSPSNNTINFYTNNSLTITTNASLISGVNATHYLYYENGTLRNTSITSLSASNVTSSTFSNLEVGRYYFNATVTNGSQTNISETRLFTVYNLTSGVLNITSNASDIRQYINVTWTNTTSTNSSVNNSYYLVKLLNTNGSINQTLINTTGNNLTLFNIFNLNLSNGNYYLSLNTTDTRGNSVLSTSVPFNITRNAQLNISAHDSTTNLGINSFNLTITNLNDSTIEYYSTTTGIVNFEALLYNSYNITYSSPSFYANTTINYSINQTYASVNTSIYPSNSLNVTVYDETTLILINQTINLTFIGSLSAFNRTIYNGTGFLQSIAEDTYSIIVSTSGYASKTYTISISNTTTQTLNAYLSNSSVAIGIYVTDTASTPLNATVNIYKLVGSSYVVVSSTDTDVSGYTQVNLLEGQNYRLTLESSGYETRTATFIPYSSNSPYTFALTLEGTSGFISPNSLVSYIVLPAFGVLNETNYTFSFQISSPTSIMEDFNISCLSGNLTDSVSGSPTGGIVQVIKNLSGYGSIDCNYTYNLDGYDPVWFTQNYRISSYTQYNATLVSGLEDFQTGNNNYAWTTIMGFFIILVVTALFTQISGGNPTVGTVSALAVTLMLGIIGWFDWSITIFIIAISFVWLYVVVRY